jgi:hypothetical protein
MIRRRRPTREIPFSFDSFLDIVANVVGIIIRLILVVWVGARSYSSIQPMPPAEPASRDVVVDRPLPEDPLQHELARHQRELADARARLLEQLRQLQLVEQEQQRTHGQLTALGAQRRSLEGEQSKLAREGAERGQAAQLAALSLDELRRRGQRLAEEVRALEKLPPVKKTLRYHTPVSRPVNSEELLFECRQGRVTFIDIAALLAEVRAGMEDKARLLQTQWQVADVAGPVGPFRLRYVLERERGTLDAALLGGAPAGGGGFRYGLSEWQLEPVALERGEPVDVALADGSEFRQIVEALDPQMTVVTFWVYPDTFAGYRRLRDFLYDRDVVVAGRPLPEGVPIASSRRGTASRGQ